MYDNIVTHEQKPVMGNLSMSFRVSGANIPSNPK
jgi:hypothetical protein